MLAPALARFLGLGPTLEIDCPRDPTGGDWQKQRVTRQQRKEKYLFRVAVKQRSGQNFRGPAARQESRRRRFHGAQEIQKAAEGFRLHEPLRLGEAKQKIHDDEGEQADEKKNVTNSFGRKKKNQEMGDQDSNGRRNDQKERQDNGEPQKKTRAAGKNGAVGSEYRRAKEQHHPGGVQRGADQARVEKRVWRNRRGVNQVQISGETEN